MMNSTFMNVRNMQCILICVDCGGLWIAHWGTAETCTLFWYLVLKSVVQTGQSFPTGNFSISATGQLTWPFDFIFFISQVPLCNEVLSISIPFKLFIQRYGLHFSLSFSSSRPNPKNDPTLCQLLPGIRGCQRIYKPCTQEGDGLQVQPGEHSKILHIMKPTTRWRHDLVYSLKGYSNE